MNYNVLINNIAVIVKKSINEAFDFNKLQKNVNHSEEIIKKTIASFEPQHYLKNNYTITDIFNFLQLEMPFGAKENLSDERKCPTLWYGRNNNTLYKKNQKNSTNDLPFPIQQFIIYLKNNGWKPVYNMDKETKEKYKYSEYNKDVTLYNVYISPDKGLALLIYNENHFTGPDNKKYTYAWEIVTTGEHIYTFNKNSIVKSPKRQQRNKWGEPITVYTREEAEAIYKEEFELMLWFIRYESDYNTAYFKKIKELEKKYNPYDGKSYNDPDYVAYRKERNDWEEWAKHYYGLDTKEYKEKENRRKELINMMCKSLTLKEYENINKYKKRPARIIFKRKWCPDKKDKQSTTYID